MKKSVKIIIISLSSLIVIAGAVIGIILLQPKDHVWDEGTVTTPATCAVEGVKTFHCSHCDETKTEAIPKLLEHTWNSGEVLLEATCTADGKMKYTCTVCNATEEKTIDKSGAHTYSVEKLDSENHKYVCSCGDSYTEAHGWADSTRVEPTHLTEGLETSSCSVCGEVKEEVLDKLPEHTYTTIEYYDEHNHKGICECTHELLIEHNFEEEIAQEPGCLTAGSKTISCSGCDHMEIVELEALGHDWDIDEPTCESGQTCALCQATTPALVHEYELIATIAVSCEANGYEEFECIHCHDTYQNITLHSTGHNVTNWKKVESAQPLSNTCQSEEHYEGKCKSCGNTVEKTEIVEKHTYTVTVSVEAKCNDDGIKLFECDYCDHSKEEPYSNPDAHNYSETSVNGNVITYTCSHCSDTKTVISAKEDISTNVNTDDLYDNELELKNASLKLDQDTLNNLSGNIEITADILDSTTREEVKGTLTEEQLAALGDNDIFNFLLSANDTVVSVFNGYITITVPYTLEPGEDPESIAIWFINNEGEVEAIPAVYSNGYATFKTYHFSYYSVIRLTAAQRCALYGHHEEHVKYEMTCISAGYTLSVCTRCGDSRVYDFEAARGHSFTTTHVEATCTTVGRKTYTCQHEGCTYSYFDVIKPLGHDTQETENVPATCTTPGHIDYACSRCDFGYRKDIKQKGHTLEYVNVLPTCTEDGYRVTSCLVCEYEKTDNFVPSPGHVYNETVIEPTCSEDGYTLYECNGCDEEYKDNYVDKAHTWNIEEATCAEAKYCVICDEVGQAKTDDHNMVNSSCIICGYGCEHEFEDVVTEPTCEEDGYTTHTCSVCSYSYVTDPKEKTGHDLYEYVCNICGERLIEEGYFSDLLANVFDQQFTLVGENITVSDELLYEILVNQMGIDLLYACFNKINKIELQLATDNEYYYKGFGYVDLLFNNVNDQTFNVRAYVYIVDGIIYGKTENLDSLESVMGEIPEYFYFPIELLIEDAMDDEAIDYFKNYIQMLDEDIKLVYQAIIRNNEYLNDFIEECFFDYFDLEVTEDGYVFTLKPESFGVIREDLEEYGVLDVLGEDLVAFLRAFDEKTIGDLLDYIDNFGTTYDEIKQNLDTIIKTLSNGEYNSLFEFISKELGLSVILNRQELYNYKVATLFGKLTNQNEEVVIERINDTLDYLEDLMLVDLLEFNISDFGDDLFKDVIFEIRTTNDSTISSMKLGYDEVSVDFVTIYNSIINYEKIKTEVTNKVNSFSHDVLLEEGKVYYDTLDGVEYLVSDNSSRSLYGTSITSEYDGLKVINKYYVLEYHVNAYKTYFSLDNFGLMFGYNGSYEDIIYLSSSIQKEAYYTEYVYLDFETEEIVKTESEIFYEDVYSYVRELYHSSCDHEYELLEDLVITGEGCYALIKEFQECSKCGVVVELFDFVGHDFNYNYTFTGDSTHCYSGYELIITCNNCDFEQKYNGDDHHTIKEKFDVSEYSDCNHNIELSHCLCNLQMQFEIDNHYIDKYYDCPNCDLVIQFDVDYDENGHDETVKGFYSINYGDETLYSDIFENTYSWHYGEKFYQLKEGSTVCSEGLIETTCCYSCGEVITREVYECYYGEYLYYKAGEYGLDSDIYLKRCYCGNVNSNDIYIAGNYSVIDTEEYSYYEMPNGTNVVVMHNKTVNGCEVHSAPVLYINYDFEEQLFDDMMVLTSSYSEEHDFEVKYEFPEDFESCYDGYKVIYECKNCDYSQCYDYYYHECIIKEEVSLSDYGCEHDSKVIKYSCLCGYESYIDYYNLNYNNIYDEATDTYIDIYCCYDCYYEDSEFNYYFIEENIEYSEGCTEHHYQAYTLVVDGDNVRSLIDERTYENHDYITRVGLLENAVTCEDGCYSYGECKDCGEILDETEVHFGHVYGLIGNVYDLRDYQATEGTIGIYGCSCGRDIRVRTDGNYYSSSYIDDYGFTYYIFRSNLDGYKVAYTISNYLDTTTCKYNVEVKLYFGVNTVEKTYLSQQVVRFSSYKHEYSDPTGYRFANGKDCKDGTFVFSECSRCGDIHKELQNGHVNILLKEELYTLGDKSNYLRFYGCPCTPDSYLEIEISGDYEYDYEDGITYKDYGALKDVEGYISNIIDGCFAEINYFHEIYYGDQLVYTFYNYTNIQQTHQSSYKYVLKPNSNSCEDGVYVIEYCLRCQEELNRYTEYYHMTIDRNYIDFTKYGAENGWFYIEGCPCCESFNGTYIDYIDYTYDYDYEKVYIIDQNGYSVKIGSEERKVNCEIFNYVILYLDYNIETREYSEKLEVVLYKYEDHSFVTESYLRNPDQSCYDGVINKHTCSDCQYSYTVETYDHLQTQEYYELYDCQCDTIITVYDCLCGEYLEYEVIGGCDFEEQEEVYIHDEISYTVRNYKCAVTDPQCKACYSLVKVTIKNGCYYTTSIRLYPNVVIIDPNLEILDELECILYYEYSYEEHEQTFKQDELNTNIPCYKYYNSYYQCTTCDKRLDEQDYYNWSHVLNEETIAIDNGTKYITTCEDCDYCIVTYKDQNDNIVKTEETRFEVFMHNGQRHIKTIYEESVWTIINNKLYATSAIYNITYDNILVEHFGFENYHSEVTREYDFTGPCTVTITSVINGNTNQVVKNVCEHVLQSSYRKLSTCSQTGLLRITYICSTCGDVEFDNTSVVEPHGHEFGWLDDIYCCIHCGLENINGVNGDIILEDCSNRTVSETDLVIGYYNPYGFRYNIEVSLILKDVQDDNQIVLDDISYVKRGDSYLIFELPDIHAAAEALGYTSDMYDIRISFVPVTFGFDLEYAITITE